MYLLDYSTGYTLETFWNPSIIIQACTVNMVFLQDYIKNLKMLFPFYLTILKSVPFRLTISVPFLRTLTIRSVAVFRQVIGLVVEDTVLDTKLRLVEKHELV